MAESLVGKIVSNAGKQWNRNTVADGTWLNTNTVQKFNQNDKTLAEAIESVSAAMEHFTPEITPSAWPGAANKTIQTIEQNADGSLNVTYQPIETSTTSNDTLWSWYKQNAYDSVLAEYTETVADINHEAGELSNNLTIPPGIYDVKVEVLYEPTKSTRNNKLDIAISKSTSIDDALYQTFILFDDTLLEADVQSQWITGIIKLEESATLKFLIKGESAQGRYKLNNIYINSIIGVKGDTGDSVEIKSITPIEGGNTITFKWGTNTSGFDVMDGEDGVSPTVAVTPTTTGQHIVITDAEGDHPFDLTNGASGASGKDGKTPLLQIDSTNAHWQYRYSTSEDWADVPNTPAASGTKGDDGIAPQVRINDETNYWEISTDNGSTWTSTDVSATGAPGRNGDPGDNGISPTVSTEQIEGGNRVTFTYDNGTSTPATESIDVMSGVSGEPGSNGISPSISYSAIPGTPGGTTVIITDATHDAEHPLTFDIRNGIDGTGATYVFDTPNTISGDGTQNLPYGVNTEVIATHDWVGQQGFITKDVDDLTNYYKKTETSAKAELTTEFAKKVDVPINLGDKYLVLRTNVDGTVSGWCDLSTQSYSKSETDGRYIQQTFIDNTLSGTGSNANNKLGANTDVIPTKDWLDDNYLPLSGGTVTGQLTILGSNFNNNLYLKRNNNEGFIGLAGNGAITFKNNVNGSTSQIEFLTSDNKTFDITVKDNSSTPQPVGKLYVMSAHSLADAIATSANWANDGMLHIILDS